MAAPWNPPKRGEDFQYQVSLGDMAVAGRFKVTPTIAAGDWKVSKDGGALANLNTLPSESPAGSGLITVLLSATEMTADMVTVRAVDQTTPAEWADYVACIVTTA